jgi:hypothetical protein
MWSMTTAALTEVEILENFFLCLAVLEVVTAIGSSGRREKLIKRQSDGTLEWPNITASRNEVSIDQWNMIWQHYLFTW